MDDLRFHIVNSNLQHAQVLMHELKSRVSFDVYQDTKEKNIWGLMDGGKDDIFVYDKCGRLAYYIPFPLSIMNGEEGTLVTSAILATYYRSPCGTTCEKNSSTLEEFLNNVDSTETPVATTTEVFPLTTELHHEILSSNQSEDVSNLFMNETSSIDESIIIRGNFSEHHNFGDIDYLTYDEALEDYDNNETSSNHDHAILNTLYSFFFRSVATEPPEVQDTNETLLTNISSSDLSESNSIYAQLNLSDHNIQNEANSTETSTEFSQTPKLKSDRCAEADPSVCKNWSKKRLLRAHNCCSSIDAEDGLHNQQRFCKNFGKKRCKKIRTILKCCLKTAIFEVATEASFTTTESSLTATEVTTIAMEDTTTDVFSDVNYDIVCCRDTMEGKLCRVTEHSTCDLGEYIQESVTQNEEEPSSDRTM